MQLRDVQVFSLSACQPWYSRGRGHRGGRTHVELPVDVGDLVLTLSSTSLAPRNRHDEEAPPPESRRWSSPRVGVAHRHRPRLAGAQAAWSGASSVELKRSVYCAVGSSCCALTPTSPAHSSGRRRRGRRRRGGRGRRRARREADAVERVERGDLGRAERAAPDLHRAHLAVERRPVVALVVAEVRRDVRQVERALARAVVLARAKSARTERGDQARIGARARRRRARARTPRARRPGRGRRRRRSATARARRGAMRRRARTPSSRRSTPPVRSGRFSQIPRIRERARHDDTPSRSRRTPPSPPYALATMTPLPKSSSRMTPLKFVWSRPVDQR